MSVSRGESTYLQSSGVVMTERGQVRSSRSGGDVPRNREVGGLANCVSFIYSCSPYLTSLCLRGSISSPRGLLKDACIFVL